VPAQDVLGAGVSANMALLDVRALHAYGTARRAIAAAERDLVAERRALAGELADALLAAWTAEQLAELHRVGLRAALDRLALTETKRSLGRATVLDVDRARQDVESARNETLQGDDALARARTSLGLLLGVSTAVAAPAVRAPDGLGISIGAWCTPSDDAERAPEVTAARLHLELAERTIDGLDLELLPRLDLQSQLRWDSETVYGPDATVQIGLVLRAPIWDGGARYGRRREAHARRTQAQLRLEQARTNASSRRSEATREIAMTSEASRIGVTQRDLASRIDQGTRMAFEQGVGTSLDLISAAQALRQAELNAVLLSARVVQARVRAALTGATCHF
jgi:outer membrane protein TolC